MADEVDTRISPSLDPGVIALIDDYDDDTRPLLGQTETALSEAFEALKGIHDAKAAAATNPTLNEYAQLIEVDNYATKRMDRVMKTWDRAIDALNNNATSLETDLRAPVEQKASHAMASEIRSVFRGMDTGPRMSAIQRAINNGDERTVTAICGAPGLLSGLDDDMRASFAREWQERQMPVEAKKVRALRAAADLLNDRVKILKTEWAKAVGVIEETREGPRGEKIVVRTITPAQVREQVQKAKKPFAVPV